MHQPTPPSSGPVGTGRFLRTLLLALLVASGALTGRAQVLPFLAPPQPSGSMVVTLHPMENVVPGIPVLVTFGVPFTRGSITAAGLSTVRVLHGGVEIPAHVEELTPWRHLTDASVDGQTVRFARIQIRHAFEQGYPGTEAITVEWGGVARALDVPALVDPLAGWHGVDDAEFQAADGVSEPDVYAVLPRSVLTQGTHSLRRLEAFVDSVGPDRDDPVAMDAVEHWPGYEELDRAFKNNFYSSVNEDDPRVTAYGDGRLNPYKTTFEPWLYDRASTFFVLHLRTGFLKPLREAVRNTRFYRSQLHGPAAVPASSAGLFRLKAPDASSPTGGNDAMYSYAECFAYDHWLTGDPAVVDPIRWVAATHHALTENSRWDPALGAWTERHTSIGTLANVVAFEVTGEAAYRQRVLTQTGDYIWHQNGAGGQLPEDRLDGGLYHYGRQHGDGVEGALVASHWMTSLMVDMMTRAYGISGDPAIAGFILRAARFQASALRFDDQHAFDTYPGALWYPGYMIRHDGQPDLLDGGDGTEINHALEVGATVAWGAYFQHLLNGVPDPLLEGAARSLYLAFDAGVNHWVRPAAPPLGLTAFRVSPWRKFSWENRPAASFAWVMNQVDRISPPPTVAVTSPAPGTRYTAPASIPIEATASTTAGTIVKVEFYAGATRLGEDTEAPYTFQWDGVIANLQGHVLTAKATTSLGVSAQSTGVAVEVVSPTRPTLTLLAPATGATFIAPATVEIAVEATAQAGSTIARVVFMQDGVPLHEDTTAPYTYTAADLLHGNYDFEIRAFDSLGGYAIVNALFDVRSLTPPSVTLLSPAPGTTVAGGTVLHFSATASAPGSAVRRVMFLVDGTPIREVDTPPYEYDYAVSPRWELGTHTITARAVETLGSTASASATVEMIALDPLTVAFDFPASGASFNIPATVDMQASAVAPGATVTRVEFLANGSPIGTDTEAPYTASFVPGARQWELRAVAFDSMNRRAETVRVIEVVGPATPQVALIAPAPGAFLVSPAVVTLEAEATVGSAAIDRVEFYDGATRLGEDTSAPYAFTTGTLSAGDHTFRAVATASTGRTAGSAGVLVTVGAAGAPVVRIATPRFPGPQIGSFTSVRFTAEAHHDAGTGIARVEYWLDNARVGTATAAPYTFDWSVGSNYGFHQLQARAFDALGIEARSSSVSFELILPPVVTLASPADGSAVGLGTPTRLVAGIIPGNNRITEVRFLVDNALAGRVTTPPYEVDWVPTVAGAHTVQIHVADARFLDTYSAEYTLHASTDANRPPVAGVDRVGRPTDSRLAKIPVAVLIGNDTDPDADPLSLLAVGNPTPAGATVRILGDFVVYTVPDAQAGAGSFTYTLSDGPGGHVVQVTVPVDPTVPGSPADAAPNAIAITRQGADFVLTFLGLPGRMYRVQYTVDTSLPRTWNEFAPAAVLTAASNGVFLHTDIAPGGEARFYRAVLHTP